MHSTPMTLPRSCTAPTLRIPEALRHRVTAELERFVKEHISQQKSFAVETTLRSDVTFHQAASAHQNGYFVTMRYLALESGGKVTFLTSEPETPRWLEQALTHTPHAI